MAGPSGQLFERVQPGSTVTLRAETWNALMDMGRDWYAGRMRRELGSGQIAGPPETPVEILIQNTTGEDIQEFGVLGIGDPIPIPATSDPDFRYRQVFKGIAPAAGQPFVIVKEPLAKGPTADVLNGAIGRAVISGETTARLNVASTADGWAGPSTDLTQLATDGHGPARILYKDPGTGGSIWGKVLLNGSEPGDTSGGVCLPVLQDVNCVAGSLIKTVAYVTVLSVSDQPCGAIGPPLPGPIGGGPPPNPAPGPIPGPSPLPTPSPIVPPPGQTCLEYAQETCAAGYGADSPYYAQCVVNLFNQCNRRAGTSVIGVATGGGGRLGTAIGAPLGGGASTTVFPNQIPGLDGITSGSVIYAISSDEFATLKPADGQTLVWAGGVPTATTFTLTGESSPAALTANVNNYAPTLAAVLRLTTDGGGPYNITGLAGGAAGYQITIINVHATDSIVLIHQSGSSSAINQFICPGGLNTTIVAGAQQVITYDNTTQRWRVA